MWPPRNWRAGGIKTAAALGSFFSSGSSSSSQVTTMAVLRRSFQIGEAWILATSLRSPCRARDPSILVVVSAIVRNVGSVATVHLVALVRHDVGIVGNLATREIPYSRSKPTILLASAGSFCTERNWMKPLCFDA